MQRVDVAPAAIPAVAEPRTNGQPPGRTQQRNRPGDRSGGRNIGVSGDGVVAWKPTVVPGGLTVTESIGILKLLVEAGVDTVQVSAGNDITPEWICQPMFMKKACLAESAARFKKALNIPVMAVGRINDPIIANEVLLKDQADLVCVGRGLLADPELPNKAREGRLDEIRICIACNTCMESISGLHRNILRLA